MPLLHPARTPAECAVDSMTFGVRWSSGDAPSGCGVLLPLLLTARVLDSLSLICYPFHQKTFTTNSFGALNLIELV